MVAIGTPSRRCCMKSLIFKRYACIHFPQKAGPSHMSAVGSEGDDEAQTRDVVLWDFRYLSQ